MRRRLSEAGLVALSAALGDLGTVNRWREKIMSVDGSECWWWAGAINGRVHLGDAVEADDVGVGASVVSSRSEWAGGSLAGAWLTRR